MSQGVTITINAATDEAVGKLNQFFDQLSGKLNGLTKASEFLSGLGSQIVGAFAVGALIESFKKAVDGLDDLRSAAQKTGLALDTLLAFKKLGRNEGLPFEELTMGLAMFNDKVFQAVRLGGDAARPFRDLQVAVTDANGALLPTEKILATLMDRFKAMPDGPQKTTTSIEMFGRAGREMIPILNEGSQALERMKAAGAGITMEDVNAAHEFNITLKDVSASYTRLWQQLAKEILPSLQEFATWIDNIAKRSNEAGSAVNFLADVFKVLATAAVAVYVGLQQLATLLGGMVMSVIKPFTESAGSLKAAFEMLLDVFQQMGVVLDDLIHGRFTQMKEDLDVLALRAKFTGEQFIETFKTAFYAIAKSGKLTWSTMADEGQKFVNALQTMWGKGAKGSNAGKAGATGAAATGMTSGAITSEEAKKLEDQVLKEFNAATMGKLQLLDYERNEMRKKLELEVADKKKLADDLLKLDAIYAAKRREVLEKSDDERRKTDLENVQASAEAVDKDPDLITSERKQKLIPLLQREKDLLQQMLDIQLARSKDEQRNPDERDESAKRAANLQRQLAGVKADMQKANQTPFDKMLLQLKQQNDLQQEVADNFGRVFNGAISSISKGITGLIEGTMNWNQALRMIGSSILNEIISAIVEMGVRWVLTQTMMALFGRSLAAAGVAASMPIAAAQAAVWAVPATLSTIASYGESAAQAPAMIAIAEGMTQALAFAEGGIIPTGERFIRVNEKGQESVLNAAATRFLGPDAIHAINRGLYGASTVRDRLVGSVPSPVTSSGDAWREMAAGAGAPGRSDGSNTTVQGHKLTAIFPSSRQETLDALKSAEGEKIVVDMMKRRRLDVGVNT